MVECVAVTYQGPSGRYSLEHDGEWYEFPKGVPVPVPETLAERLLDVAGHDFEVGDEVEIETLANEQGTSFPVITGSGSGSGEGSGSGDDPERVNAASPYGGK